MLPVFHVRGCRGVISEFLKKIETPYWPSFIQIFGRLLKSCTRIILKTCVDKIQFKNNLLKEKIWFKALFSRLVQSSVFEYRFQITCNLVCTQLHFSKMYSKVMGYIFHCVIKAYEFGFLDYNLLSIMFSFGIYFKQIVDFIAKANGFF